MVAVAVIGSLNVDFVTKTKRMPQAGETILATSFDTGFGGKGANQAVACKRLSPDLKVYMVGSVGDDSFGQDYKDALHEEGIDTSLVEVISGHKTGIANIIVEEDSGENRIMVASNANFVHADLQTDVVPKDVNVILLQLELPVLQVLHNCKVGRKQNKCVILNPAPALDLPDEIFECLDCLIMNETEAQFYSQGAEDAWHTYFFQKGARHLVIRTLGEHGLEYVSNRGASAFKLCKIPACKVDVNDIVDTTAAGDTFVGALAAKIAENGGVIPDDPSDLLNFANSAAAVTIQKKGAMSSIPYLVEVESMVK